MYIRSSSRLQTSESHKECFIDDDENDGANLSTIAIKREFNSKAMSQLDVVSMKKVKSSQITSLRLDLPQPNMSKGRSYKKTEMSGVILSPKISKIADDVDAPLDSIPDEQNRDSPIEPRVVRQTMASPSSQLNKSPNQKIL